MTSLTLVAAVAVAVLVAGCVNGIAGFGFALVGTMALASVVNPTTAVVFMVVPILAVNLSLVRELSVEELETCGRRFGPLLVAALAGTVVGMLVLDRLPEAPLRVVLGALTLSFVLVRQSVVPVPGLERARDGCFVENPAAMVSVGGVFGVVFGGTNVGVQFVAYLRSCDLSHGIFVGVVAMLFVGLNGARVVLAGTLGHYPSRAVVLGSLAAVLPAVLGVALGLRLRDRITESHREGAVLALLTVIGARLLLGGLGVA